MGTLIRLDDPSVWPVLLVLLQDRTMKRNIIWATGSYAALGEYYRDSGQITAIALQRMGKDSIQPRILKAQEEQQQRTRKHGEVQTPAWLCCRMNDYLDETWFERENVFNVQNEQSWVTVEGKIAFPKHRHSSWRQYVDSRRLEITCGEAPFIVSRYDAATGEAIPIERRIGLLDRKLRIVSENTDSEAEWVKWAIRAIESVYGYEYQGDNLLIARINVLMTFVEYLQRMWHRGPTEKELATVANVIIWNFWQMDGLTGTVPKGKLQAPEARPITMEELGWFATIDGATSSERPQEQETAPPCRICNWRQAHTVTFDSLKTHRGRDVRNMKFDFCIGNPPYQEESIGANANDTPVYHYFYDAAFEISAIVELITPARFLFNAGGTPKIWNERMLSDEHLKVCMYEQISANVFPGTSITGGVAVLFRHAGKECGPIGVFTSFPELNSIIQKVDSLSNADLSTIVSNRGQYRYSDLAYAEEPEEMKKTADRRIAPSAFERMPRLFTEEKPSDGHDYIRIYGVMNSKRVFRWFRRDYVSPVDTLDKYKVFISKADGAAGTIGAPIPARICGKPVVLEPGVGAAETFITIGSSDNYEEAEAIAKYIRTKFARTMLGVLKVTQNNAKPTWGKVPLQDFTTASDIDWTQPIPAIDQQLYRKYGLTEDEITFIESHVKEMT